MKGGVPRVKGECLPPREGRGAFTYPRQPVKGGRELLDVVKILLMVHSANTVTLDVNEQAPDVSAAKAWPHAASHLSARRVR